MTSPIGLDLRSLGLWRISLGLVLVLDWLIRSFSLREHYTCEGVLPLRTYLNLSDLSSRCWSVFYLNDSVWFVTMLFVLGALSSLALMLGYRTAHSGWVAWVLLISIQHRTPLVLTKGDSYLALILFWGNFLPWGRAFSLDQEEGEDLQTPCGVPVAAAAYLGQVCLLYWFTALQRNHPSWVVDGSALYRAFHVEPLMKEPAYFMLGLDPRWLVFFTFVAILMEAFGPFLLLIPLAPIRLLAVGMIVLFHLGIYVTLDIHNFAWICMVAPLGLLPSLFWRLRPGRWLEATLSSLTLRLSRLVPLSWRKVSLPSPGPRWRPLGQVIPGLALLAACWYLWFDWKGTREDSWEMNAIKASGLGQSWGMFSPGAPSNHGWQSIEAHLASGVVLDLFTERPYPPGQYHGDRGWLDQRWRVYRNNLLTNYFGAHGPAYLQYMVARWNNNHPDDPVESAEYLWHSSMFQPDGLLPLTTREVIARYHR